MKESLNLNRLKESLLNDLPGEEAQLRMSPTFRDSFNHATEPVKAAVLILMYPRNGQIYIVFIKRNEYDGPHSGQVSLPGGAWEKGDGSLENTALRETREELGITDEIEILGSLTELLIPVSNFLVSPFVGFTASTPVFHLDVTEVQFVIESPISDLLDPRNVDSKVLVRHGQSIKAPFYRIGDETIWGATAMILSEFLQLASILQ